MEMKFAQCRSMGHEWRHLNKPLYHEGYGMIGMRSTCNECGMKRIRWVSRSGETFLRYDQPDGYAQHGDERLSPQAWRTAYVTNIFNEYERATA